MTKRAKILSLLLVLGGLAIAVLTYLSEQISGKCGGKLSDFEIMETFTVDTSRCLTESWSSPPYYVDVQGLFGDICRIRTEKRYSPDNIEAEICEVPASSQISKFHRLYANYKGTFCGVIGFRHTVDESYCKMVSPIGNAR